MSLVETQKACPMCQSSIVVAAGASWVQCGNCGKELAVSPDQELTPAARGKPVTDLSLDPVESPSAAVPRAPSSPSTNGSSANAPGHTTLTDLTETPARVVIAIDFGTSRSGYAYAFLHDRRIVKRTAWPDQPFHYAKTSTNILWDPSGQVAGWGFTARKEMARLRRENKHQGYVHLTGFKIALRKGTPSPDGPTFRSGTHTIQVVKLVADYLRQLKTFALTELQGGSTGLLTPQDVRWCLTIPAIWSDEEKRWMRVAAEQAGLIEPGADAARMQFALEPEAAALHCLEQELGSDPSLTQLKPGTRFMIVDAGGGTVDITVHEVEPGPTLKELIPGAGSMHGAMEADNAFRKVVEARLGSKVFTHFQKEEPYAFVKLLDEWEQVKCNFQPLTPPPGRGAGGEGAATTFVPLGAELYRLLANQHADVLARLRQEQTGDEFNLHLDEKTMMGIFEPTLAGVVDAVKRQFDILEAEQKAGKLPGERKEVCDYLFLVGGFANSVLLQERIKKAFADKVLKIIIPPDPGAAVLTGAVAYGLDPSRIRTRRARLTYGCRIMSPFEEGVDPEPKKRWDAVKNGHLCRDRFKYFVQAGDAVGVDQEVKHSFRPTRADQKECTVVFYASPKKSPRYTDEFDVFEIGKVIVKLPDGGGVQRRIQVVMRFGRTEVEVRARDMTTGKETEATLRFSSTYQAEADKVSEAK